MPLKVMDLVEQRLAVLQEPGWSGRSVSEVCARHGISRDTFYAWKKRYDADGLSGLVPTSRRPRHAPGQISVEVEDLIVALRKRHGWGPGKIRHALIRDGRDAPAASTVQQVLARRGLTGQPRRRPIDPPAAAVTRFERATSNELWQIDGAYHQLADKTAYWSVELVDDHSRFCVHIGVGPTLTAALAWTATRIAVATYGMPAALLSDNGRCFTGRLWGETVMFERRVREAGMGFSHSRPAHPQTCGKVERFHGTQRGWLGRHDIPETLAQAGGLMEIFRVHYNTERPHQAIDGQAPADRYRPGIPVLLPTVDLEPADHTPPGALARKTSPTGRFTYSNRGFDLGERFAGVTVGVLRERARLHVYYGASLLETFLVDPRLPTPTR